MNRDLQTNVVKEGTHLWNGYKNGLPIKRKKKSFKFKFEIVQTALSNDNIIQLEIKSKNRSQRKSPTILGRL